MFQTDQATASSTLPTPAAAGTQGYFTNGNPASGIAATILDADFMNMVMMELVNVVSAGGLTPSKTTYTQVRDAVKQLILGGAGVAPVVGTARNLAMSVPATSSSATMTADEIIVGSALGGLKYTLSSFSKTINLATTGAGGMDTGSAPTSGFVALYAIYNPSTGASALLATNANAAAQPSVYGGANMPAGYTASALVSVWPAGSGGTLGVGVQRDRKVSITTTNVLSTSSQTSSYTSFSIAGAVPLNAKTVFGSTNCGSTSSAIIGSGVSSTSTGVGSQVTNGQSVLTVGAPFADIPLATPQTLFYIATASAGTMTFSCSITGYTF
jgi:hypothetical protein